MGGPCPCGDFSPDAAYRLLDGTILVIEHYPGCRECGTAVGVNLSLFPSDQNEWVVGMEIEPASVDEYGGNNGRGLQIDLLGVEDLIAALPVLEEEYGCGRVGPGPNDYETMADWLRDHGYRLLREAFWQRAKRQAKENQQRGQQDETSGS